MSETRGLIQALKQALRQHPMTYAEVATGLGMSEANVKRLFASERITLDRVEAICRLIDMGLSDLFALYSAGREQIQQLSEEQEQELVADARLLLVAVCVRNELNFVEILQYHHLSETELIRCLAKLDRLKVIDLLPGNRIRLRIDRNFRWIENGPIEQFYRKTIQHEFINGRFEADGRRFCFGMLGRNSQALLKKRLEALAYDFIQLHLADRALPWDQRNSVGLLMALREWEFSILSPYVKESGKGSGHSL